jgi:hypothetical protein
MPGRTDGDHGRGRSAPSSRDASPMCPRPRSPVPCPRGVVDEVPPDRGPLCGARPRGSPAAKTPPAAPSAGRATSGATGGPGRLLGARRLGHGPPNPISAGRPGRRCLASMSPRPAPPSALIRSALRAHRTMPVGGVALEAEGMCREGLVSPRGGKDRPIGGPDRIPRTLPPCSPPGEKVPEGRMKGTARGSSRGAPRVPRAPRELGTMGRG